MKLLKLLKKSDVLAIVIIIASIIVNLVYINFLRPQPSNIVKAIVQNSTEITEDGGLFFQKLTVKTEEGETKEVRANLASDESRKINNQDKILLYKIQKDDGSYLYQYKGPSRADPLLWIFVLFLIGLFITIGIEGIKYLFPFLVLLPFLISSVFVYMLANVNPYLLTFALIGFITLLTGYLRLKDRKLTVSITISVLLTLAFVFLINLILQKVTQVGELYFLDSSTLNLPIGQRDYIRLINLSVLFIAFGAVINSSMEVSTAIKKKRVKYNLRTFFQLLRNGIDLAQKTTGREINNLFFVLFGGALVALYGISKNSEAGQVWDSIVMVEFILNFISASLAVILIAPVSSIVSTISSLGDHQIDKDK